MTVFHVGFESQQRAIETKTGLYSIAAVVGMDALGLEPPVDIKIWSAAVMPEYGPHIYTIEYDRAGNLKVVSQSLGGAGAARAVDPKDRD